MKNQNIIINNSDLKIYKHELVTVEIPSGATKQEFMLPDLRNLRNVKILGIEIWKSQTTPKTPSGGNVMTMAQLAQTFITLENYGGKQFLKDIPALAFDYTTYQPAGEASNVETLKKTFNQQRVNFPKCYIKYLGGAPGSTVNFMMSVYYADVERETESDFANRK